MKNALTPNGSSVIPVVVFVIGILIITSWIFLIAPNLKNDFTAFKDLREYEGTDAYVKYIGEKLPPSINSKDILKYKVINVRGNVLEIISTYTTFDAINGEKIYENSKTYFVDRITRKHVNDKEYYFNFPTNVEKQNYFLIDPNMEVPATFVFEGVKYVEGLEVYEFSCKNNDADFSDAWSEFSPEKIYGDQTCETYIEPVTGKTVHFLLTWDMYAIQEGKHITIERGNSKTTNFTEHILLEIAKNTKYLFYIYDVIVPIFIILIFIALFFISIYNKKLRAKEKIIIEQFEEVKQINESKIKLLEKQAKQEKFSIVGEISAKLSHDIRNPLAVLTNEIYILKIQNKLDENQIRRTENAISRISHQVDGVLNYLRESPLLVTKFNLTNMIKNIINTIIIPSQVKIITPDMEIFMIGDEDKIEVVLINLIFNAIQAIENSGTIEIILSETNTETIIEVKDTGPGIPEDKLGEIFEPLFTTKQKGTGLGLASVKNIIIQHQGTISVKNNPTTFIVKIPKKDDNIGKSNNS